jgi:hypothetical protein
MPPYYQGGARDYVTWAGIKRAGRLLGLPALPENSDRQANAGGEFGDYTRLRNLMGRLQTYEFGLTGGNPEKHYRLLL